MTARLPAASTYAATTEGAFRTDGAAMEEVARPPALSLSGRPRQDLIPRTRTPSPANESVRHGLPNVIAPSSRRRPAPGASPPRPALALPGFPRKPGASDLSPSPTRPADVSPYVPARPTADRPRHDSPSSQLLPALTDRRRPPVASCRSPTTRTLARGQARRTAEILDEPARGDRARPRQRALACGPFRFPRTVSP